MEVAGGGDEDVGLVGGVVHRDHAVAFHRRLQRADRVDLGDPHLGRQRAQRLGRALADVAVAGDDRDLAGDHHVGRALDAVDQRLAAAVEVVELALGHRVVDVDGGKGAGALLRHLVEALHAGGGLLGDALHVREPRRVPRRILGELRLDRGEERGLFLARRVWREHRGVLSRPRVPRCSEQRGVAAVVEDHVRRGRRRATRRCGGCTPSTPPATRPCRRRPACPPAAIAAAAWSWVEKMLHDAQRTSAPSAFSVSISTAVWIVMCSEPAMRAPFSGWAGGVLLADRHQARASRSRRWRSLCGPSRRGQPTRGSAAPSLAGRAPVATLLGAVYRPRLYMIQGGSPC